MASDSGCRSRWWRRHASTPPMRARLGRAALAEHDGHKLKVRAERAQSALEAVVEMYAHAKELFAAWQRQRVATITEADAWMVDRPEAQKLEFLRKQTRSRCGSSVAA